MGERVTTCDSCGACCMGQNLLPLSGHAIENTVGELKKAGVYDDLVRIWNGYCHGDDCCPCVWLNRLTGRCLHYELRPLICREFAIGSESCLRVRKERKVHPSNAT